ncbi:Serine/threonine-protein kinase TOR [Coccomyxa sp. Obi]|nr:Serine/threonine-protein kinase TOR [Coccomyxa sp. Obi]
MSGALMKGGKQDHHQLARILADLCRPGVLERRREAEHQLQDYVECEARDLSGEPFTRFMNQIYKRIYALISSNDQNERLGGVLAIDELIDVKLLGEDAAKTSYFASYLREVFQPNTDPMTMEVAASTLGHLVKSGGALTADIVEFEVRRAIEWLGDRGEARRYAAALILRELAENAPAVFNVHVRAFIEAIWAGLRDSKLLVREASVAALRACLVLVEKRETRYRVQWYYRLFEETQRGLTRYPNSVDHIHGSLLALGELLRHTGEFMLARYREVVEIVLHFRESKEKLIRRAVISLIPRLAAFAPERFAATYLSTCTDYLINIVKTPNKRGPGFVAIGDMALALASAGCAARMEPVLPRLAEQLREAIAAPRSRKGVSCPEALQCVGVLAEALRGAWKPYAAALIEPMILMGLSPTLVLAFQEIVVALPELLGPIQAQLLDLVSVVLAGRPLRDNLPQPLLQALHQAVAHGELQGAALTRLALQTLVSFDFGSARLLDFVRDHVTPYLDDADVSVRRAAAAAAAAVLHRTASVTPGSRAAIHPQAHTLAVEAVVSRLLMAACADTSVSVRRTVLQAIQAPSLLDSYLAQADSLRALFVALNDESGTVRALAVAVAGRLAALNPAYIMPALRKHLMQLLSDMALSPDSKQREGSAHLLGRLINACPRLVLPYVSPILKALVAKLRIAPTLQITAAGPPGTTTTKATLVQGGGESGVVASVLATTGELARVAGPGLRVHIGDVLPLIIEAIQDTSGGNKRLVAVSTLGQVVESTGLVMTPYIEYPQLLGVLLRMLNEGEGSHHVRREVLKTLGIIGALDPHTHKVNQADLQGEGKLEREGVRPQRQLPPDGALPGETLGALGGDELGGDLLSSTGLVTSSEEYYPTVAINALMRTLRDPAMSSHHPQVVRSLFYIFQALQLQAVPYLPKVMSVLLGVLRNADEALSEFLVQQVTALVALMKAHMRKWLPDILQLIADFWSPTSPLLPHLLKLLSELAVALRDDIRAYLPGLLPKFVALFGEAERGGGYDLVRPALACLEALGTALEDHLALLLPALVRLIHPSVAGTPVEIRRAALHSMRRLLPRMPLAGSSAAVLHPLLRVLDGNAEELRRDAADTICSVAIALGPDFALFVPTISRAMARHKMVHERFARLAERVTLQEPPCMSDADDWESNNRWIDDLVPPPEPVNSLPTLPDAAMNGAARLPVNEAGLRRAWESSQRSTKEDWAEWMRHFSVELLKESPSPALRATHSLAQVQPAMARDLFPAGFVSCWAELEEGMQEALVRSLEAALASPSIPKDIVTTLLNLAEFMEHDEKSLPLDTRTLGALAEKCHAFAKALHYKEVEFAQTPETAVEALISINNQLRQPEAAIGILAVAQNDLHMELKESWYEKLNRWEEALEAYERKYKTAVGTAAYVDAALGRLRCLGALAEWERLSEACRYEWRQLEPHLRSQMAYLGANAAWHMGQWDEMATYVGALESEEGPELSTGSFMSAVLNVRQGNYGAAKGCIERSRELLGQELAALVGESYERAYQNMVRVQQLTELEETIDYSLALTLAHGDEAAAEARRELTRQMWRDRLNGVQRNHEVWQSLLSVRSLVLPMHQDTHTWLKFASLCRKSGRPKQANRTLRTLLGYDPTAVPAGEQGYGAGSGAPDLMFGFLKHLWATQSRHDALQRMEDLGQEVTVSPLPTPEEAAVAAQSIVAGGRAGPAMAMLFGTPAGRAAGGYRASLVARVHLRLGMWRWNISEANKEVTEDVVEAVKRSLHISIQAAPDWAKAWHNWGLFNVNALEKYSRTDVATANQHVAPAVAAFFKSVSLSQASGSEALRGSNLQDILRLLTLWFTHGAAPDVEKALEEGFTHVSIDTWLVVIPQVIARIHDRQPVVRRLIHSLLVCIGRHHPQALMYPLLVASKSQSGQRRNVATSIIDSVRQHSATLVEQAQLVSTELIRMAILWHEMWHEALEEASRQYFGESNVDAMLGTLMPLHEMMARQGPTTLKEIAFVQAYGRELAEAYEWCQKYRVSRREAELHQAWDLYYHVFKRINKQLPSLTVLELQYVAPALVRAQGLELAVPGTYIAGEPVVTIAAFAPQLHVITSKQRPRKLTIHGSDGAEYMFLLKGHEDLRQDERVMQLFGLVNTMLAHDRTTAERDLSIARYAVIPLSPNSGLIGWVPNTDTLHALIREYRDARKIPLNVEHRLMLGMAPDYDHLTVIQKVEVFEHALDSTSGEDLHKVLWLKSRSSEVWLERRTHYTRSTGVMSMVGYLLGLGDRHPSNLMLDRYSGKLLHIDFGDCFEASMNREKFPERVPFRLTRMMVKAMEVSGVEGNFRSTCESVMRVLRSNKDSVMAMLEAFVYDPLINWRLVKTGEAETDNALAAMNSETLPASVAFTGNLAEAGSAEMPSPPRREAREREMLLAYGQLGDAVEFINERAVAVMKRMSDKLTGRDFVQEGLPGSAESDSIQSQVQRLIVQAYSHENLCQSYIGWCPFW